MVSGQAPGGGVRKFGYLRAKNHQICVQIFGYLRALLAGLCPKIWVFEGRFLPSREILGGLFIYYRSYIKSKKI
jgi:hypothetical protein